MKISIFGLGYVGCVGMGCLAELGNKVIGVDINEKKVDLINSGKSAIVEQGLDDFIKNGVNQGKIEATTDAKYAVLNSDISFVCVGTPSNDKGHLDMSKVYKVAQNIGDVLREKSSFHVITIRSTVMPGTFEKVSSIIEQESGKKENEDFALVSNPEFLREGTAVKDFFNPPCNLIASNSERAKKMMRDLYKDIDAETIETEIEVGEIIKLVNNSFHALKVCFANEIGRICKKLDIDSHKVMDIFCKDTNLNISPAYFKPGFAYGGSCLPKDLKALSSLGIDERADTPLIKSVEISNKKHIEAAKQIIDEKGSRKIGFLGVSFKPGTDDMRFSPGLEVAEYFIGKGYDISIFDSNINLSKLMGKNKEYLLNKLPHISEVLVDSVEQLVNSSEIIIVVNQEDEFDEYMRENKDILEKKKIIDFTRINEDIVGLDNYEGICW